MRVKILCGLVIASIALTIAVDAADAATPRQATKQIAACLLDGGAHRIERHGERGGRALYGHRHSLVWAYITWTDTGEVAGIVEIGEARTHRQRRAVTRCMAPFNT